MSLLLALLPLLPLASFLLLVLVGARLPRRVVAVIGTGFIALAMADALVLAVTFITAPPPGGAIMHTLYTWLTVGGLSAGITFRLDALSLVFCVVVTIVGFLVHLYSTGYMRDDQGYTRFFSYMNLFVASMLILVLADNLLLLYLGWEGVGLCSYLLIGFWYSDPANVRAAFKAFFVTRIGDTAVAIAILLLFTTFGTVTIQSILRVAPDQWAVGSTMATAAAVLILLGAVAKSAQVPLQVWLPDAMAGPTPVSALLHAATMVTAGVYLIARLNTLFTLAPGVQMTVAIIGAVTLLIACFSALVEHNIKRVLAYSTMSQVGYMFLALGIGAWAAGVWHFVTHAFFKCLLFLAAGLVIKRLNNEHDIRKMGGLRKAIPLTFWTFVIGAMSLSAVPFLTAGFYSKDLIIYAAWVSALGGPWYWFIAWLGAILTGLYSFRLVFLIFFGKQRQPASTPLHGWGYAVPLLVLAVVSVVSGVLELPRTLGNHPAFTNFLQPLLPPVVIAHGAYRTEVLLQLASEFASLLGIFLAYWLFVRSPALVRHAVTNPVGSALQRLWNADWGFDWWYDRLIVQPYCWLARVDRHDVLDTFYTGVARASVGAHDLLSASENGNLRRYALGIAVGTVVLIAMVVWRWY